MLPKNKFLLLVFFHCFPCQVISHIIKVRAIVWSFCDHYDDEVHILIIGFTYVRDRSIISPVCVNHADNFRRDFCSFSDMEIWSQSMFLRFQDLYEGSNSLLSLFLSFSVTLKGKHQKFVELSFESVSSVSSQMVHKWLFSNSKVSSKTKTCPMGL